MPSCTPTFDWLRACRTFFSLLFMFRIIDCLLISTCDNPLQGSQTKYSRYTRATLKSLGQLSTCLRRPRPGLFLLSRTWQVVVGCSSLTHVYSVLHTLPAPFCRNLLSADATSWPPISIRPLLCSSQFYPSPFVRLTDQLRRSISPAGMSQQHHYIS